MTELFLSGSQSQVAVLSSAVLSSSTPVSPEVEASPKTLLPRAAAPVGVGDDRF